MTFNWKLILFAVMTLLLAIAIVIASYYRSALTESQASLTKVNRELNLAKDTIADMQTRQRDVAALDAKYTQELADANATIESLRADVSAGRKRLQVAATCAKSTTGASSMGDGESPRLTADAELNYYRLRSGIDRITAQVNYLQEYIRTQCLK
ncbi:TPA: lysis protein [Cronobacter sakazakii]|nr:lysis protein [Cronobacter sakazakii]